MWSMQERGGWPQKRRGDLGLRTRRGVSLSPIRPWRLTEAALQGYVTQPEPAWWRVGECQDASWVA